MGRKCLLIDVSRCIGSRSCQVACKQWNQLKAEPTFSRGVYQNPVDLSPVTWTVLRFNEAEENGQVKWTFFKDQCRHCLEPPCMAVSRVPGAIIRDESGAVIFTPKTRREDYRTISRACPYDIPRYDYMTGVIYKCRLCFDRISNGLEPACVKACPTGALQFGERDQMLKLAHQRLAKLKRTHKKASIVGEENATVVYILPEEQKFYLMAKGPRPSSTQVTAKARKPLRTTGCGSEHG